MAAGEFIPGRVGLSQTLPHVDEPVFDSVGERSTVQKVLQPKNDRQEQVLVKTAQGMQFLLPIAVLQRDKNDILRLPLRFDQISMQSAGEENSEEVRVVLPVVEETLDIAKTERVTGRVRITKSVSEREAVVDETLARGEVVVERVPINRVVERPAKQRYEGETLIIPIHKEVLVVEKQLMLVEELYITHEQKVEQVHQTVTLRNEDITVERLEETPPDTAESS
jgi:uncharacterized protein (TIGR02271 family)